MGLFRAARPSPFQRDYRRAQEISTRSGEESHKQFQTEVSDIDMKYGDTGGMHNPAYMAEYTAAYNRHRDRMGEIADARNQTIGTLQMRDFSDKVRSGEVWSPDPALNQFGNRNLNPLQFGE